jgi:tetratricopeptide (TPR) repeat protein
MLDLAEQAARELLGPHQATRLAQLEREHDNLAAALRWGTDSGATELGLRLAGALWRFWWLHGHLSEGMAWLDSVLSASSSPPESLLPARAAALNGAGVLAQVRGEYERATELIAESLDLSHRLGLRAGIAAALHNQGALARERGDWPRALRAYEEGLSLEREMDNTWGIATSLTNLGALAADQGAFDRARALLNQSLALQREVGDVRGIASALHNLAAIARETGDWQQAVDLEEQSLATWRKLSDRWGLAAALHDLARVVTRLGDSQRAARLLGESLALFVDLGVRHGWAVCLEGLAAVACATSHCLVAARLLGAAHVLRTAIDAPLPARDRQELARIVSVVRAALPQASFRDAWRAGESLRAEDAASEAIRLAAELGVERPTSSEEPVLTAREREVVGLVARWSEQSSDC